MTTISEINAAIQRANNEIEKCNSLKTSISELSDNIIYCTRKLEEASSSISTGLIINGKSADDGSISEISNNIKNAKANIEEINPSIDTRIQELQKNIATWKNEITQLQKTTNV